MLGLHPCQAGMALDLGRGCAGGQGHDRIAGLRRAWTSRYRDVVIGTARGDALYTGGGRDRIHSRGGDDLVDARRGGDLLQLGPGETGPTATAEPTACTAGRATTSSWGFNASDYIAGGTGDDRVRAGLYCDPASSYGLGVLDSAPNTLLGGPGDDYLTGDLGDDFLDGGPGLDRGTGGAKGDGVDVIISVEERTEC